MKYKCNLFSHLGKRRTCTVNANLKILKHPHTSWLSDIRQLFFGKMCTKLKKELLHFLKLQ